MNRSMITSIKRVLQRKGAWGKWRKRLGFFVLGGLIMAVIAPLVIFAGLWLWFSGRMYPHLLVGGVAVGNMSREAATERVAGAIQHYRRLAWPASLNAGDQTLTLTLPEEAVVYYPEKSVEAAFTYGRRGALPQRIAETWELLRGEVSQPLVIAVDPTWIDTTVASLSAAVNRPAVNPSVEAVKNTAKASDYVIVTHAGIIGQEFEVDAFTGNVHMALTTLSPLPTVLPIASTGRVANQTALDEARVRAEKFLNKTLDLVLEGGDRTEVQNWQLKGPDLVAFLAVEGGFDRNKIGTYVHGIADSVNRPAQDAKLTFDTEKGRVSEFLPAKDGLAVDEGETAERVMRSLSVLERAETVEPVALQVTHTKPTTALTDVNNLGIKELIGHGESTYFHSIPTRVHNVALAASRINGTIVKPGETFSFNAALGDVSAETGYQQAYVIKEGRTQLGDGGGVCQDSTTVFRAALDAGLPIVERRGHAYRVGYYEQNAKPGLDATVYAPSPDLKFLNDTPAAILIQAKADSTNLKLVVDLYGASDGRKSEISNHVVWDITPPPPDIYQDDPTLKTGVVKQVDWKASGAKAKFDYTVRRDGQEIYKKTFLTVYQPWASVYLRGIGP